MLSRAKVDSKQDEENVGDVEALPIINQRLISIFLTPNSYQRGHNQPVIVTK